VKTCATPSRPGPTASSRWLPAGSSSWTRRPGFFPAIPQATDKAEAAFKAKGVDLSAFLINVKEKTTFLFPITDHASQITGIMTPAMDDVLTGKSPPESLTEANNQVNQLFG
jgi:multiple sugar transport system substrate-binding protein